MKNQNQELQLRRGFSMVSYNSKQLKKSTVRLLQSKDKSIGNLIEKKYKKYCLEENDDNVHQFFSFKPSQCETALGFYEMKNRNKEPNLKKEKYLPRIKGKNEKLFFKEIGPVSPYKHQGKLLRKLTKVSPHLEKYKYESKKKSLNQNIIDYYKTKYGKGNLKEGQKEEEIEESKMCIDPW